MIQNLDLELWSGGPLIHDVDLQKMGKRKKYEEEKFTFNYPEDGDDVWTKNLDSRDMEKRLKKIAKKEKKKAKKEKKKIEKAEKKAQEVDLNNQFLFAQAEAKVGFQFIRNH